MPGDKPVNRELDWFRVAIAITDDGEISPTHFGDAERMLLARVRVNSYEIMDNIPSPLTAIEETHANRVKLNHAGRFLKDIQIIVTGKASINFKKLRIERNKWPMVTTMLPEAFLRWLAENLEQVDRWYQKPDNHVFQAVSTT